MKSRQDFIEADYVNGVQDSKGNLVIRPLTEAERDWLSQFYAETEHGNFKKTEEISRQNDLYKQLVLDYKRNKKFMSLEEAVSFREKIDQVYEKLVYLRSETNTFYPENVDRKEVFDRGNIRKDDIFNRAKSNNKLISLDLHEFDDFTTRAEKDINPEHLVLDYLTRKPAKKVIRRKKK